MTVAQFRKHVKTQFPHVTIYVRSTSFVDLARDSRKALTVYGAQSSEELETINQLAREAGILPDESIHHFSR